MELHRLGIKFFIEDPAAISLRNFIPVFHDWIQKQVVAEHLLIDVHDYSHMHHGPGILLVAHEGNFSIDLAAGRPGLMYFRKQPLHKPDSESLISLVKPALQACSLLERESSLGKPLRFQTDELLFVANDRLHAPNDENTFLQFEPVLSASLKTLFDGASFDIKRAAADPKERFALQIHVANSPGVHKLLSRIS